MPRSYYEQGGQQTSLFDQALSTMIRGAAGQMVGDFFDKVPEDVRFASQEIKSQISSVEGGKRDALNSIQLLTSQVEDLSQIARHDAFSDKDMLLDQYAIIDKNLNDLTNKQGNVRYYDVSSLDEFGNPQLKTLFDPSIAQNAEMLKQIYNSHKPMYDQINTTTQGYIDLDDKIATARKKSASGFYESDGNILDVLKDMGDLHTKNTVFNGKYTVPLASMKEKTDKYTDIVRAMSYAAKADWDKETPGIQVIKDVLDNPFDKKTQPDEWKKRNNLQKLFNVDVNLGTITGDLRANIIDDFKKGGLMKATDGTQDITYGNAAFMVERYFQNGQSEKAMVLLDRMLPDQNKFERKKEIESLLRADETMTVAKANQIQASANKKRQYLKGYIEQFDKDALKRANEQVYQAKQSNDYIFKTASTYFKAPYSLGGKEENTKFLGLYRTGEWEINEDSIPLAEGASRYLNHFTGDNKFSSTVANPEINILNTQKNSQLRSAKDLMKIIGYTNKGSTKAQVVTLDKEGKLVVDTNKKLADGKDNPNFNKPIMEKININEIDQLSDNVAYMTLKHSRENEGLLWKLGLGVGDNNITEQERASRIHTRSKKLTGNISDKTLIYSENWNKGEDGRFVLSLGKHWMDNENRLNSIASPERMERIKTNRQEYTFLTKVLHSGFDSANEMTPEQKTKLESYSDSFLLSNGKATLGSDGTTITPKPGFSQEAKDNIAAEIARKEQERIDINNMQIVLAAEDQPLPGDDLVTFKSEINKNLDDLSFKLDPRLDINAMDADSSDFSSTDYSSDTITSKETDALQYAEWINEQKADSLQIDNKPALNALKKVTDVSVKPVEGVLDDLELQSVVPKKERSKFKSVRDGYGKRMTPAERIKFTEDGIIPEKLIGDYNRDKALSYGNDLTSDLKDIAELKNYLVKAESRVEDQLENQGKHYYTDKTMQSARRNVSMTLSKIKKLENSIRSDFGQSINPTTGLLSDDNTNKAVYDLLARIFPNKSIEELRQMMMQYSTSETEDYALTK